MCLHVGAAKRVGGNSGELNLSFSVAIREVCCSLDCVQTFRQQLIRSGASSNGSLRLLIFHCISRVSRCTAAVLLIRIFTSFGNKREERRVFQCGLFRTPIHAHGTDYLFAVAHVRSSTNQLVVTKARRKTYSSINTHKIKGPGGGLLYSLKYRLEK